MRLLRRLDSGAALTPRPWWETVRSGVMAFVSAGVAAAATMTSIWSATGRFPGCPQVYGTVAALCLLAGAVYGALAFRRTTTLRTAAEHVLNADPHKPVPGGLRRVGPAGPALLALQATRRRAKLADQRADKQARLAVAASAGVYELVTGMVEAEERIRAQLVADLHDTVAQELVVAGYIAADADETLGVVHDHVQQAMDAYQDLLRSLPGMKTQDLAGALDRLSTGLTAAATAAQTEVETAGLTFTDTVRRSDRQLRDVMAHARPPELADGDLGAAIDELVASFQARNGLRVNVTWPQDPIHVPFAAAVTTYRYVQETLRNVVKHAGVDRADLEFAVHDGVLTATVRDAGRGMRQDALTGTRLRSTRTGHHVGLELLRSRAALLGASVEIDSVLNQGTTVTLRLPTPTAPVTVPQQRAVTAVQGDRLVRLPN